MMKYYKDANNEVFAYDVDGSQDSYIKADKIKMTKAEIDAHLNPKLSPAEIIEQHNIPILAELSVLDAKRIRPLAEGDTKFLNTLNTKIAALRASLK